MIGAFYGIITFSHLLFLALIWGDTNEPRKPRTVWMNVSLTLIALLYLGMTTAIYWEARS
jgi:hypothetical protein